MTIIDSASVRGVAEEPIGVSALDERIPFLAADVKVLPLANISVEELARWFLGRLLEDRAQVDAFGIESMEVDVASGPGQGAAVAWRR